MAKEKKKKTWWQRLLIILAWVLGVLVVFFGGVRLYFRLPVKAYYDASEKTFKIPDINSGFIAQGLSYQDGKFYSTGYMNDGSASPIYVIDKESELLEKTIYMKDTDGSDFCGHCGGLTVHNDYVYVASHDGLNVYSLTDIQKAEDKSYISPLGFFATGDGSEEAVSVAFTAVFNHFLVVGEFYRPGNYETPTSHRLTTPAGDQNTALAIFYRFDSDAELGLSPVPDSALSITDQIQGMEFNESENKLYLSSSYGVAKSHIYVYDLNKITVGKINYCGYDLELGYLDSACLAKDIEIAPMSEEIVYVDNKLYTMCESASNKYIFGKFTSAEYVYATDLTQLEQ